jgi:hypothetical protein
LRKGRRIMLLAVGLAMGLIVALVGLTVGRAFLD